jgi:7-cyano-7-deazaguanine synthase
MKLNEALSLLPDTDKNVLSVMSGGLDSGIMTMMLVEKYGADRVVALSYDYGQKQRAELERAAQLCKFLNIGHKVIDLAILGKIAEPISANIAGTSVEMPTIKDVLGDPQPKTYVPFRNLILLSLTMAQAEASDCSHVFTGLQVHDEYGYWDTSQKFVDSINAVAAQNRTHKVEVVAPFSHLSKYDEIRIAQEMGKEDMLQYTLTCYDPIERREAVKNQLLDVESCGKCPSCAERIQNFAKAGLKDPITYRVDIPWDTLIKDVA